MCQAPQTRGPAGVHRESGGGDGRTMGTVPRYLWSHLFRPGRIKWKTGLSAWQDRFVSLRKFAKGPRGDTAQVPRAAWARGKQACWLPGATRAAATLSCRGAVLSLLSLAICLHPSCSVAPGIALCCVFCPLYPALVRGQSSILQLTPPGWLPALRGRCLGHPAGPAYLTLLGFLFRPAG